MQFFEKIFAYYYLHIVSFMYRITGKKAVTRVPEPMISDDGNQVEAYDLALDSSMSAVYAWLLNHISDATVPKKNMSIIDVGCGPGLFTSLLKKKFQPDELFGVDLSDPMLVKARKNNGKATILKDDFTKLESLEGKKFDLVVGMECMHHLSNGSDVKKAFKALEEASSDDGVVFISDPSRLKTTRMARVFTRAFGHRNRPELKAFQKDFELSMAAAWTGEELESFVPDDSKKTWYSFRNATGFVLWNIIIGVPKGRKLKIGHKIDSKDLVPDRFINDFNVLNLHSKLGRYVVVNKEWTC